MTVTAGSVVVVGSVNLDVSVSVDRLPRAGETLLGGTLRRSGGGKGANQAVAAARAGGARTAMVGRVGADPEGDALREALQSDGIDCAALETSLAEATGLALITVDGAGENTIVVAAGANDEVTVDEPTLSVVAHADVVLAQLEIPQEAVLAAARARRAGALFVLNAAPYAAIDPQLLDEVDLLVVNEHEALGLSGADSVDAATACLLERVPAVLVTLGAAGAVLTRRGATPLRVPASPVEVVDTTGAGDTFCGVLGAALARGEDDLTALRLASAAASLAVQHPGAQDAVPSVAQTLQRAREAYGTGETHHG